MVDYTFSIDIAIVIAIEIFPLHPFQKKFLSAATFPKNRSFPA